MFKTAWKKYSLNFITPGGTSRGILKKKETYLIWLEKNNQFYYGECALFKGLSIDDRPNYEKKLELALKLVEEGEHFDVIADKFKLWPSILFGIETALLAFDNKSSFKVFDSEFYASGRPITINGLIWMNSVEHMLQQFESKVDEGFQCIKIKVGALDFEQELNLLRHVRQRFSSKQLELRLDANGAFTNKVVLEKLNQLSEYHIHSIEQPVKQGQLELMRQVIKDSPIPIALDEELIGITEINQKYELLEYLKPAYIILKPSLIGGFTASDEWITVAEKYNIGWWVTSALESNIGLNAIAQYCSTKLNSMPQGLGTGQLFSNNFQSPLTLSGQELSYSNEVLWETPSF